MVVENSVVGFGGGDLSGGGAAVIMWTCLPGLEGINRNTTAKATLIVSPSTLDRCKD